ncbi:hypothetical protein ACLB2K_045001 [Fragaria x ananassa]
MQRHLPRHVRLLQGPPKDSLPSPTRPGRPKELEVRMGAEKALHRQKAFSEIDEVDENRPRSEQVGAEGGQERQGGERKVGSHGWLG